MPRSTRLQRLAAHLTPELNDEVSSLSSAGAPAAPAPAPAPASPASRSAAPAAAEAASRSTAPAVGSGAVPAARELLKLEEGSSPPGSKRTELLFATLAPALYQYAEPHLQGPISQMPY